tara:strand:- start:1992 stop:2927 length:936 start_codon:yes stop_codon:yes gene_type:complete
MLIAQANSDSLPVLPILGSLMLAASVFVLIRVMIGSMTEDPDGDDTWRHDQLRMAELRKRSLVYRFLHPLVIVLARVNRRSFRDSLPGIARDIHAAGLPRFWTPQEYLARIQILAALLTPAYVSLGLDLAGPPGLLGGLAAGPGTAWLLRRRLAAQAAHRLFRIKQRLPFLLDLLTLLMEAGATFMQSLEEAVAEFRDHPVGNEFGRVLSEINMGKSRVGALEAMRDRLDDPEITSIIGSIIQGETLGTPLARLFRTQADVLRIKRTQRAETIAGEAGVKMLLPSVLVMAATVLIILGPFVLSFIYVDLME